MRRIVFALSSIALLLPLASGPASASHPTQMCLDLWQEHTYDTRNDDMLWALRAYVGATDAGHPAEHDGCVTEEVEGGQNWSGTNIDFEISGDGDPDASDSPTTPDMTCTVSEGSAGCAVVPETTTSGNQTIRGWIDFDLNDQTVEADLSEGVDEEAAPGDMGEPDATDVVLWHWSTMDTTSETFVPIHYTRRTNTFHGTVTSDYSLCSVERTIKVFKRRADGRRLIGTAATDRKGHWRLEKRGRIRGRFYAVAPETTRHTSSPSTDMTCLKGRSPTIRVR